MKDKDIIEGNSVLAEYMGWVKTDKKLNEYIGFEHPKQKGITNFVFNYDNDWNELMKVVEKIETTDYGSFSSLRFTIVGGYCGIVVSDNGTTHSDVITEKIEKSEKIAVWKVCLDFIKKNNNDTKIKEPYLYDIDRLSSGETDKIVIDYSDGDSNYTQIEEEINKLKSLGYKTNTEYSGGNNHLIREVQYYKTTIYKQNGNQA